MAQLTAAAFQSLSFASCVGNWQPRSPAVVSLKASAFPFRLYGIRCTLSELTPKELHHLRKKEAQKKVRKIRKESRAKRRAIERAERLAKLPVEKPPNAALCQFSRPSLIWNRPWTKRKALNQLTLESFQGNKTDYMKKWKAWKDQQREESSHSDESEDMKTRIQAKDSDLEDSETAEPYEWIQTDENRGEFTSMKSSKISWRKSRRVLPSRKAETNPLDSWRRFEAAYEQRVNGSSNKSAEFRSEHLIEPGSTSGELRTGTSRELRVDEKKKWYRRVEENHGNLPNSQESDETDADVKIVDESGCTSDGLRKGYNARNSSEVRADERKKWYRGVMENYSNFPKNCEYDETESVLTQADMPCRVQVERNSGTCDYSFRGKSSSAMERLNDRDPGSGHHGANQTDEQVESTEFWDRQGDERYDRRALRKKFEGSAEAKKFTMEQRLAARRAYGIDTARVIIGRRKGENVYLNLNDHDAAVARGLPRSDLDEGRQLEWLAKQLDIFARPDGVHFSRLMRSGGLKITDGRAVILVQKLGELGNWRCAMRVVEWLNSRNQYPAIKSRYVFTTLLSVLQKARRPVEALNVFNVMQEHVGTYPDMASYHTIAVTLGQAGHMEELLELMHDLSRGPDQNTKYLLMLKSGGCLDPDVIVYNAALNSCVPHRNWRCALWILDQLTRSKHLRPNSASYGLMIEVLVKARMFDLAWEMLHKMELGGFCPNSSTYKVLVEGLGQVGKPDVAINVVKEMESRGIVPLPSVYYALAYTLCLTGRWKDALVQVDRLVKISDRPLVETYTGLIRACQDAGRWQDAINVFQHMQDVCAPNTVTCNIMITVYAQVKMFEEAKDMFHQVSTGRSGRTHKNAPRLTPNSHTYDAMLGACTFSRKWEDLEVLCRQMFYQGYQLSSQRHSWIIGSLSLAGKDNLVEVMFNHLRSLNDLTSELYLWMIHSCLQETTSDKAFGYLEEMIEKDMGISSSELQRFLKFECLLPEDERLNFINKVKVLRVTSEFYFNKLKDIDKSRLQPTKDVNSLHPESRERVHSHPPLTEENRPTDLPDEVVTTQHRPMGLAKLTSGLRLSKRLGVWKHLRHMRPPLRFLLSK